MAVNGANYFEWTPSAAQIPGDVANPVFLVTHNEIGTGHGFWTNVASDGSDIRVTLDDGTTEQPFHVIFIDTTNEILWLRFRSSITITASAPETFRVYYNSADSAYAATDTFGRNNVYQDYELWLGLDSDPTGTAPQFTDFTGNGYNGTSQNLEAGDLVAGKVYNGIELDGGGTEHISLASSVDITGNMSVRMWGSVQGRKRAYILGNSSGSGGGEGFILFADNGSSFDSWRVDDAVVFSYPTINTSTLYFGVITRNTSDEWRSYNNGSASADNPITDSRTPTIDAIGRGRSDAFADQDGISDAVAVATFTYSANRVSLEFNNEDDPGAFATAGAEQSGSTTTTLEFDQGSYSVTGQDIGLIQTDILPFNQGIYSVTGQDIGLVQVQVLEFEQGSYTITGSTAETVEIDVLEFAQGSYSITGNDIGLILTQIMEFGQGAYVVTGNDIIFDLLSRTTMSFGSGNYSVTGNDIDFVQRDILAFEQGSYSINGQDINLVERRVFQFEQGEYVITGYDISIRIEDSPEILILVSEITTDLELDSTITTELELDSEI